MLVEPALVADAEAMLVIPLGMGANQVLVARLVGLSVAGDVVVVARESEPSVVTADEGCHGKRLITPRGRAMNDNEVYCSPNISH